MTKSLKIFRLFSVDVKIHWSWLLLLIIWVSFGSIGEMLVDLFTLFLLSIFVLVHEFGHVLMARKYGVPTKQVVLNIMGGAAYIDTENKISPKKEMLIVFAGPLTNLVLFILLLPVFWLTFNDVDLSIHTFNNALTPLQEIVYISTLANGFMFLFNLVPIYPLDGGRIVRSALDLFKVRGGVFVSIRITQIFSLLIVGLGMWFGSWILGGFALFLFALSIGEIRKKKREVIDHELSKIFQTNPTRREADKMVEDLQKKIKDHTLFKDTDLYDR